MPQDAERTTASSEAVWVRYVDVGPGKRARQALNRAGAHATVHECNDQTELSVALRAARLAKIVVLDSHGWMSHASMGRRVSPDGPDYAIDRILEDGALDETELLILGGCNQGRYDNRHEWRRVAPHAVIEAVSGMVEDGRGCRRIAEIIAVAQQITPALSAAALNDRVTGRPRFVATDPRIIENSQSDAGVRSATTELPARSGSRTPTMASPSATSRTRRQGAAVRTRGR